MVESCDLTGSDCTWSVSSTAPVPGVTSSIQHPQELQTGSTAPAVHPQPYRPLANQQQANSLQQSSYNPLASHNGPPSPPQHQQSSRYTPYRPLGASTQKYNQPTRVEPSNVPYAPPHSSSSGCGNSSTADYHAAPHLRNPSLGDRWGPSPSRNTAAVAAAGSSSWGGAGAGAAGSSSWGGAGAAGSSSWGGSSGYAPQQQGAGPWARQNSPNSYGGRSGGMMRSGSSPSGFAGGRGMRSDSPGFRSNGGYGGFGSGGRGMMRNGPGGGFGGGRGGPPRPSAPPPWLMQDGGWLVPRPGSVEEAAARAAVAAQKAAARAAAAAAQANGCAAAVAAAGAGVGIGVGSDKVVVIMRGLPGAGKSTRAAQLADEARQAATAAAAAGEAASDTAGSTADEAGGDNISSNSVADAAAAAAAAAAAVAIHSTDSYFVDATGVYRFTPELLPINHQKNFDAFSASLANSVGLVIVDNTNLQSWQFEKYVTAAWAAGYKVRVEVVGEFTEAAAAAYAARNTHGVPHDKILMMLDQWRLQ